MNFSSIVGLTYIILQLMVALTTIYADELKCQERLPILTSFLKLPKMPQPKEMLLYDPSDPMAYDCTRTPEILKYLGYSYTVYHVTGWDGYIFSVYRINKSKYNKHFAVREPVIIQHGISSTSADFLSSSVDVDNLPLLLVENGYDVWIPNARGSTYSRGHVSLNDNQEEYWDFSWDEIGRYDIPALIDTVLHTTGFSQLSYIGHSMGCAMFCTAMHYHPHYAAKVRKNVLMSPAIFMGNSTSTMTRLASIIPDSYWEAGFTAVTRGRFGGEEFLDLFYMLAPIMCHNWFIKSTFCFQMYYVIGGYSTKAKLDTETILHGFTHFPDMTAIRCATHYLQIHRRGTFETQVRYHNLEVHVTLDDLFARVARAFAKANGEASSLVDWLLPITDELPTPKVSKEAKPYNLHHVNMPTLFIVGSRDSVTTPCDAYKALAAIGATEKEVIVIEESNHLDVLMPQPHADYYGPALDFLDDGTPTSVD